MLETVSAVKKDHDDENPASSFEEAFGEKPGVSSLRCVLF